MALNPLVDSRDVKFVLFEMLEIDGLTKKSRFEDFDKDMFEDTLNLAETIAVNKMYPINFEADKSGGAKYNPDTKEVKVPAGYKEALSAFSEAGFNSLSMPPEVGGMGMPESLNSACMEYFSAGCLAFSLYPSLTAGATNLIITFGTEEQKSTYLEKMLSGEWGGTMCLTEPDAGSEVGALKTKAVKQADGTYLISGQKIFISSGENDMYDNIIHPVLARIEGDPAGTKGISIFIVPKYFVNEDGSLGGKNDLECSGIEHKMGIKGSATCTLSFGDNNKCVGYLLGEERQGMKIMFQMMNEARLYVGLTGQAVASTAYMHAVTYAKNRIQGRHVTQMLNKDAPMVPIVQHPDVKRMLLRMKSYVEGMRMLSYFSAYNADLEHACDGEEEKEAKALVELLTPIVKGGNTNCVWDITGQAIQVYGGYGFINEYPVEQFARDCKILSLYEGTNGIQAMDLTMRKILMNPDQYNFSVFKKRVSETIKKAKGVVDDKYVSIVQKGLDKVDEVIKKMTAQMGESKFMHLFMNASPLLDIMFMFSLAWFHLWSLTITAPKLKGIVGDAKGADREKLVKENLEAAFYSGKVLSSQFYIGAELKKLFGMADYILDEETAVLKASDEIFTGAPEE